MKRPAITLTVLLLSSWAGTVFAQEAPAGPPQPEATKPVAESSNPKPAGPKTVEGVTVTAPGSELQTSIDRRSYSLAKDLQATTGSLADALRNIPSVEIDPQGHVSLRGDPNVTILVDGKPSNLFNGQARGDVLQQLPADQVDRVEVIPTPPASMTAEGSAGVINIVMKKALGVGPSGSVYALYGSQSAGRAGGTFGFNSNEQLNVTGFLPHRAISVANRPSTSTGTSSPAGSLSDDHRRQDRRPQYLTRYYVAQIRANNSQEPKTHVTGSGAHTAS